MSRNKAILHLHRRTKRTTSPKMDCFLLTNDSNKSRLRLSSKKAFVQGEGYWEQWMEALSLNHTKRQWNTTQSSNLQLPATEELGKKEYPSCKTRENATHPFPPSSAVDMMTHDHGKPDPCSLSEEDVSRKSSLNDLVYRQAREEARRHLLEGFSVEVLDLTETCLEDFPSIEWGQNDTVPWDNERSCPELSPSFGRSSQEPRHHLLRSKSFGSLSQLEQLGVSLQPIMEPTG